MTRTHLSPAEYVLRVFSEALGKHPRSKGQDKGVRALARVLGRSASSVSSWTKPIEQRGTGGQIPRQAIWDILAKAKEMGLDLNPNDLLLGREVQE